MDQVGCTVCHEGMGQSVTFRDAAHAPRDEKQKAEWEEKYHWEQPHLWDYPMLPTKHTEASCYNDGDALPTSEVTSCLNKKADKTSPEMSHGGLLEIMFDGLSGGHGRFQR